MLPEPLPARYLRTLAHDPGGYDPTRSDGVSSICCSAICCSIRRTSWAPEARRAGPLVPRLPPERRHRTPRLTIEGVSDRPGNVDLTTAHFRAGADNRIADPINMPSLRGVRFTGPYGRDGRTASLSEFVRDVVTHEFGGAPLPPAQLSALVRYVQDLDFLPNANLDARGRLTARASASARRGEMPVLAPRAGFDGGSCATCHVRTSFFRDGQVHRLTSGRSAVAARDRRRLRDADAARHRGERALFPRRPLRDAGRRRRLVRRTFALGLSRRRTRADLTAYLEAVGAVDRREDDRPRARRMIETFVYLGLLVDGEARDDRAIWNAAIDAVLAEIVAPPARAGGRGRRSPSWTARLRALAARVNARRAAARAAARRWSRRAGACPPRRRLGGRARGDHDAVMSRIRPPDRLSAGQVDGPDPIRRQPRDDRGRVEPEVAGVGVQVVEIEKRGRRASPRRIAVSQASLVERAAGRIDQASRRSRPAAPRR